MNQKRETANAFIMEFMSKLLEAFYILYGPVRPSVDEYRPRLEAIESASEWKVVIATNEAGEETVVHIRPKWKANHVKIHLHPWEPTTCPS